MPDPEELVRRAHDAWNRDCFDDIRDLFHPDLEWMPSGVFMGYKPLYKGIEEFHEWWRAAKDPWEWLEVDVVGFRASGDEIAVHTHFRARGRESGADVEMDFLEHWHLRDGLVWRREAELASAEALERYGLGRDAAEILRRGLRAWSEGDEQGFLATLHPDIEWHTLGSFPGLQPIYHGHDGVMDLRRLMLEAFERIEITPERITVDGDRVHALCHWHSRGKGSGANVQFATLEHLDLVEGLCIRRTAEQPTPEALERYGLAG